MVATNSAITRRLMVLTLLPRRPPYRSADLMVPEEEPGFLGDWSREHGRPGLNKHGGDNTAGGALGTYRGLERNLEAGCQIIWQGIVKPKNGDVEKFGWIETNSDLFQQELTEERAVQMRCRYKVGLARPTSRPQASPHRRTLDAGRGDLTRSQCVVAEAGPAHRGGSPLDRPSNLARVCSLSSVTGCGTGAQSAFAPDIEPPIDRRCRLEHGRIKYRICSLVAEFAEILQIRIE